MNSGNDLQLIADFGNETFQTIFDVSPDFSLDGWDKSGATAAVGKTLGNSVSKLLGSWEDIVAYKERQYQWTERSIANAEAKSAQLFNLLSSGKVNIY